MSTVFKIPAVVAYVGQLSKQDAAYLVASGAGTVEQSRGWFVRFENSWERLYIGPDDPGITPGRSATITIEFAASRKE